MIRNRLKAEREEGYGRGIVLERIPYVIQQQNNLVNHLPEQGKIKEQHVPPQQVPPLPPQQEPPIPPQHEATTSSPVGQEKEKFEAHQTLKPGHVQTQQQPALPMQQQPPAQVQQEATTSSQGELDKEKFEAPQTLKDFIQQLTKLMKDMGENFSTYGCLLEQSQKTFPNNDIDTLMGSALNEIWEKWSSKVKDSQSNSSQEKSGNILNQDEEFFASDAIGEVLKKFETQAENTYQGKKVDPLVFPTPNMSLPIATDQLMDMTLDLRNGFDSMPDDCGPMQMSAFKMFCTPEQLQSLSQLLEKEHKPHKQIVDNLNNRQEGADFEEGKRPKRIVQNLSPCFRSPFMVKYEHIFKNMKHVHTQLSDYAFQNEDLDEHEPLYWDSVTSINRQEMQSLSMEGQVMNNVIDAWTVLLNLRNKERRRDATKILLFKTTTFTLLCTNKVNDEHVSFEERTRQFIQALNSDMTDIGINNIERFNL